MARVNRERTLLVNDLMECLRLTKEMKIDHKVCTRLKMAEAAQIVEFQIQLMTEEADRLNMLINEIDRMEKV